jgi:hypothetical protein
MIWLQACEQRPDRLERRTMRGRGALRPAQDVTYSPTGRVHAYNGATEVVACGLTRSVYPLPGVEFSAGINHCPSCAEVIKLEEMLEH